MKRILVAGGAGFLGSHLIQKLLKDEHVVVCIDNLQTGLLKNIASFIDRIEFVQHDITNPLPELGVFDEIYNFACVASPVHYQKDPIHTFKTNVIGAMHLLELARKSKATIFQSSTSEVYGDPLIHPQVESYWGNVNPIGIRSCYDEGKRGAETLFFDYYRTHGVHVKVARIFNTYGPNMAVDDGRVVSNFIIQALKNEPFTVYGDGTQTRSLCYIDDLIDGILALMETSKEVTGPINLGNPTEFTMNELVQIIQELTGTHSKIIYKALPLDDPKMRKPNIEKAKIILHWSPKVDLREGLKNTISYFKLL